MPPRVPRLRKAMTEQHERARALLGQMHPDAICLNGAMIHQ
jgi:hypothetical protein